MIGVSLYFQDINMDYLYEIQKCGITHIFTSLVVLEEDYSGITSRLNTVQEFCSEYKMMLIPDVSLVTLEKLGIERILDIKKFGFEAIRIDGGFQTVDEIKELSEEFSIYLNASDVNPSFITEMREAKVKMDKVAVMHNFYPKVHTGLNKQHMVSINKNFKEENIKVGAFVQGDIKLRGPVYEGLPTLEKHRGVNPYVACVELLKSGIDNVFIGDNEADIETLNMMIHYQRDGILSLKAVLIADYEELYNMDIPIRRDLTDSLIRLSYGRGKFRNIQQSKSTQRYQGNITIDNELSGRYMGEINICKRNLSSDGKVNIIGHIYPEFVELLEYIDRDTVIRLIK